MGNNNIGIFLVIALLVVGGYFLFFNKGETNIIEDGTQTTSGELTRSIPTSVSPNSQFIVSYSSNKQGKYGAIIVNSVSGGCTFQSGKTEYKNVIISENGPTSETVQVTSPSSGNCIFTGDYNFDSNIIKFQDQTIEIK